MSVVVGRWQIKIPAQFYMEASQTRDYGVAKSADTSRGSPSSLTRQTPPRSGGQGL